MGDGTVQEVVGNLDREFGFRLIANFGRGAMLDFGGDAGSCGFEGRADSCSMNRNRKLVWYSISTRS